VRIEEFVLEDCQLLVVQVELELQRVIGHPASALEDGHDLVEDVIKLYHDSSRGFQARALASSIPRYVRFGVIA
jgi:hypothetical protein